MHDDHLNRLLAPKTEIPWYKSIVENIRELIHPEKLPPLELTSKPVPVKDLWGQGTNPKALASSFLVQLIGVAILLLLGTNAKVQKTIANVVLIAPTPPPKPVPAKPNQGGGGGARSPLPPIKAELPKPAPKVFTPPLVTIDHPALVLDASLIAPPDAWAAPTGAIGKSTRTNQRRRRFRQRRRAMETAAELASAMETATALAAVTVAEFTRPVTA